MRRICIFAFALTLTAPPAQAGQPIYVSMAECAGLSFAVADFLSTPSRRAFAVDVANTWADEAERISGMEMTDFINDTADEWSAKGATVVFSQDFKDWTEYCGSLARHRKIEMPERP